MTDIGIKRLIMATALEAEMQGMIADNKQRALEGLSMAYVGEDFDHIAEQIRNINDIPERELEN